MKAMLAILLVATAASGQVSRAASRPGERMLTRTQMLGDLDVLGAAIRGKWAYLEDKEKNFGLDLTALLARTRTNLKETMSRKEFHDDVLELIASLEDGHAAVFTLGVPQPAWRWPFEVSDTADGVVVVKSEVKDVPAGVEIVQVDGDTIEDAIARAERRTIASSRTSRRFHALARLQRSAIRTVNWRSKGGSETTGAYVSCRDATSESGPANAEPVWSVARPPDGVARLRCRSFTVDDWAGWLAAPTEKREGFLAATKDRIDALFHEIAGSKALILDLRGNTGGTDLLGIHLAQHLLPKRFVYYKLSGKVDGKWTTPHGYEHDPLPAAERFDGPLAILIDEDCFSVTDNVLRAIVENRDDVITVGRPTNGGTGAPAVIATLPASETFVTLCTMRVYGPKGGLIEGRGTIPTISVRWTAQDYLDHRDRDEAAALEALSRAASRAGK